MQTRRGAFLVSALCLSLPACAFAQLRGFELGAAGNYLGWSSLLPPASQGGTDDRIGFLSQWGPGASLSLGFGRSVALRANAVYARSALISSADPFYRSEPVETAIDPDVRVLSASGDLVIRPLGSKPRRLLFLLPVVPYLAVGGGLTWIDPINGQECEDSADALCGTPFASDTSLYLLERRTEPTGLAAFGLEIPFHRYLGLTAEVGDRVMRSPVWRLAQDASGNVTRGERVDQVVHGAYARLGVRLFPTSVDQGSRTRGRPTPPPVDPVTPVAPVAVAAAAPADTAPPKIVAVAPGPYADATAPTPPALAAPTGVDSILTLLDIGASVDSIAVEPVWTTSGGSVAATALAPANGARKPEGSDGHYDVVLDVPNVSVDEITLEVNNLHAHVSLDAKVAKLVSLNVGADASIDRVFLGIRGVQAEAYLKVDLDNVTTIVDRVLTTIDRNPQIISGLLATLETTVQTVGSVANTALQPGGVVSQAVETVGEVANTALQPGGVVSQAVQTVGDVANTALQPGGVASQLVETVGGTLGNLTAEGGLLSAQGINALGQTLTRTVDATGRILERTLDQTGTLIGERVLGTVLQLPILGETTSATGQLLRLVHDVSGALIEVTLDAAGRVLGTRVLQQGGAAAAQTGPTAAALIAPMVQQASDVVPAAVEAAPTPAGVPIPSPLGGSPLEPSAASADQSAQQGTQLLLVAVGVTPEGNILQRVVDPAGTLLERVVDPMSGKVLSKTPIDNILRLGLVNQRVDSIGNVVRVVQDISGALIELTVNQTGVMTRMRALKLGSATASAARSAAAPNGQSVYTPGTNPVAAPVARPAADEAADEATVAAIDSVPTLLLGQYQNERGHLVQRYVDLRGNITERYLNTAGQLVVKKRVSNARRLPLVREFATANGEFVRIVRDDLGALLEIAFARDGKVSQVRVLSRGAPAAAARPAAPNANVSSVPPVTPVTPVVPLGSATGAGLSVPQPSAIVAVLAETAGSAGQVVQRVVDTSGRILERTLDASGRPILQREAGSLLQLRVMSQLPQGDGRLLLIARDVSGVLLEVMLGPDRRVVSVKKMG